MDSKILCVDDEPAVLSSLRRMIRRHIKGSQFTGAGSVADAQECFKDNHFDIVITDMKMPIRDGLDLLKWIKATEGLDNVQVILLTGLDDYQLKRTALNLGASDMLNKPVDSEDLMARINNALKVKSFQDKLAEQNKVLEQKLRESQRLEQIGTLASGLVHDMKNMMAAVVTHCEILAEEESTNPAITEGLEDINDAGNRALDLLMQVHKLSRPSEEAHECFDIVELIQGCIRIFRASSKTDLTWAEPSEPIWVRGNQTQLLQVVLNLVVNAKDALFDKESGASIKVETTVDPLVEGNEVKQFFILKVTDNGCGMNEQTLEHLFETSYTTKAERGGTGLGLSIVRQMVENHSGKIEVESVLGTGTTFTVSLKAEEKPAEEPVASGIEAA